MLSPGKQARQLRSLPPSLRPSKRKTKVGGDPAVPYTDVAGPGVSSAGLAKPPSSKSAMRGGGSRGAPRRLPPVAARGARNWVTFLHAPQ